MFILCLGLVIVRPEIFDVRHIPTSPGGEFDTSSTSSSETDHEAWGRLPCRVKVELVRKHKSNLLKKAQPLAMFNPNVQTPLTILDPRSNAFKFFYLSPEVIILPNSSSNHMQTKIDPKHTNTGDQKVLQNLVDRVTRESDRAIPSTPLIEPNSYALVPRPSIFEAPPIQSRHHGENESDNDDEGKREGLEVKPEGPDPKSNPPKIFLS